MTKPSPKEMEFDVGGYTLRGRLYEQREDDGKLPILALHGWLDNAASFSFLAPLLAEKNHSILALDLPGHGNSDHRPGMGAYNIWADIPDILEVIDQLGWQETGLIGHSRGAMITTLLAAAYPQVVGFAGLIDGIIPIPVDEGESLEQLRKALVGSRAIKNRPRNTYPDFAAAVKAREEGFIALGHEDATVLAERGVKPIDGQFYWASDKKLLIPSERKFSKRELENLMKALSIDLHFVVGKNGLAREFVDVLDWVKTFPRVKISLLEGGHHLHMSQAAEKVARVFLKALDEDRET